MEPYLANHPDDDPDSVSNDEWRPECPYCLPSCDRLDGHDGRDAGACMHGGEVLKPGPLDLIHGHPDIPVYVPKRGPRRLP